MTESWTPNPVTGVDSAGTSSDAGIPDHYTVRTRLKSSDKDRPALLALWCAILLGGTALALFATYAIRDSASRNKEKSEGHTLSASKKAKGNPPSSIGALSDLTGRNKRPNRPQMMVARKKASEPKKQSETIEPPRDSRALRADVLPEESAVPENLPKNAGGLPRQGVVAREVAEQLLEQLARSPSPTNRANAAIALGRRGDVADLVVPALLRSCQRDPAPEVRTACLRAFGKLSNLGPDGDKVKAYLKKFVFDTDDRNDRWVAADSLVRLDPNSPHAKQILRTALVGGKGLQPFSAFETEVGVETDVMGNRLWAYKKLASPRVDATWAVNIIIRICEVEGDALVDGRVSAFAHDEYLQAGPDLLVRIAPNNPAVLAHLKKYVNTVFPESDNASELRIHYDTLIKELALQVPN